MVTFTPKTIAREESLGEKLRQARLFKGLKIEDIAKKINIRADYLIALEEENQERLPAGLYGKKFLTEYAAYLGFPAKDILKKIGQAVSSNTEENPFSQKIVKKSKFIIFPKIIRNSLMVAAVAVCFLYLTFYFRQVVSAPDLKIFQPEKNLVTKEISLTVSGQTEKEAEVRINGETVLNNHDGLFSQTVNLKRGLNEIIIKAKKKYSRESVVIKQILVEN